MTSDSNPLDPDLFEELEDVDLAAPGGWQVETDDGLLDVFIEHLPDGSYRAGIGRWEFTGASVGDIIEQVRVLFRTKD